MVLVLLFLHFCSQQRMLFFKSDIGQIRPEDIKNNIGGQLFIATFAPIRAILTPAFFVA